MTSNNPITGDALISKKNSEQYKSGWDAIWGKLEDVVAEDSGEEVLEDGDVLTSEDDDK